MATNHLASETSPYLLQHAGQPVDWYPWGPAALERAVAEDKPILLSVGYSACHWCHVMAHESFEDPAIAAVMNEHFINIKVDREERPDLDHIYQIVCQLLTQAGGWPLTVFLTPQQEPFFAGTYFPPEQRYGRPGFREILVALSDAYRDARAQVAAQAHKILEALQVAQGSAGGELPGLELVEAAGETLLGQVDPVHGGFGDAPKFPSPCDQELLLRVAARGSDEALEAVVRTCLAMRSGGLFDQLGGGFHRYCVDRDWTVPHFEKMLYDNALLAPVYLAAGLLADRPEFCDTAAETLDWLLAEMRSPEGLFYAATDADSDGGEGRYFVWTPAEVAEVLEPTLAALACEHWGITPEGNFEEGASVLTRRRSVETLAAARGLTPDDARARLDQARRELLAARAQRPAPFRDEKAVASWNGLAIRAFAEVGAALGRPDYIAAARTAANFVLEHLLHDGHLHRIWHRGEAKVPGYLDDYGAVALGLLELFGATGEPRWFAGAEALLEQVERDFADPATGDYFLNSVAGESLVVRPKDCHDAAMPSGMSLVAHGQLALAHLTGDERWRARAERLLGAQATMMRDNAWGTAFLIAAVDELEHAPATAVVAGDGPAAAALVQAAWRAWRPGRRIVRRDPALPDTALPALLHHRTPRDGAPAAYLCQGFACQAPVTDPAAVASAWAG